MILPSLFIRANRNMSPPLISSTQFHRQERVFLVICGIFFGTLGIINLLGVSRFIDVGFTWHPQKIPFALPLGLLSYPILLLCTNLIAEFFGKERAQFIVWLGLLVNLWILAILWIAGHLPPEIPLQANTHLPEQTHPDYAFYAIRKLALSAIVGSTIAYIITQTLEVHLFQYYKQKTQGKYLWLRYNISAFCSQLIDTFLVVGITFFLSGTTPTVGNEAPLSLGFVILSCYLYKIFIALICLVPFYGLVLGLRHFLENKPIIPACLIKDSPNANTSFNPN